MRKIKEKLSIVIVMFFIMVTAFIGVKKVIFAEEFEDAVNIPINGSVMGNTEQGANNEADYYKFTVSNAGYVVLNFQNPLQKNADNYWTMYLYNSDYKEICKINISGANTSTDSTAIGVVAGTYYVKVNSVERYTASSTDIYTIHVNYKSSGVWEKEFNENFVDSTPISINETYYGTTRTGNKYEKDYYNFEVIKNGCIKLYFTTPLQEDSNNYWKIHVYNAQYELLYARVITGNKGVTELPFIGISAGKYYILIESAGEYTASSTDIYGVKVNYETSDFWEQEINDDFTSATPIMIGSQYSGTILSGYNYEKDFYKFNISSAGLYAIGLITPNLHNGNSYWHLYLYDASYRELGKRIVYGNNTFHSISQVLPVGVYYVKVTSDSYGQASSMEPYKLKVNTTTKAEVQAGCEHKYTSDYASATYFSKGYKIYKCKLCGYTYKEEYSDRKVLDKVNWSVYCRAGKKKIILLWSPGAGASGYQLRYSAKKNLKHGVVIKNIRGKSKSKKTISKLKRKKKYYVQIRAYKKSGSDIVYGKWSAKKSLRTK